MLTTPHIRQYNERVKQLNQTHGVGITLSASEARNLHTEIFGLLELLTQQQQRLLQSQDTQSTGRADGGSW